MIFDEAERVRRRQSAATVTEMQQKGTKIGNRFAYPLAAAADFNYREEILRPGGRCNALWGVADEEVAFGHGGYAFDGSSGNFHCFSLNGNVCEGVGTDPVFHYHINPTGPLGGIHAGYN